jgi:hypothetical protein
MIDAALGGFPAAQSYRLNHGAEMQFITALKSDMNDAYRKSCSIGCPDESRSQFVAA